MDCRVEPGNDDGESLHVSQLVIAGLDPVIHAEHPAWSVVLQL